VICARDGRQAIELCSQPDTRLEAAILDTSLPGFTGRGVLERLRAVQPEAKILLVAGYVNEELHALETTLAGVQIVQKPCTSAQLLEGLRQLLDRPLAAAAVTAAPERLRPQEAKRRVLVVDDDTAIRLLCARLLSDAYEVTTAPSARAALAALSHQPYELLLTDLQMPEMDGAALMEEALQLRPGLKLLVMSGSDSRETAERLHTAPGPCPVICKPFTAEALRQAVERCW